MTVPVELRADVAQFHREVAEYSKRGFALVFWPRQHGKGPHETGWQNKTYGAADWREGLNVGVKTGTEIAPGRWLVDVDLDWTDGVPMVRRILPKTGFGFGRASKHVSHAFYTTSVPIASISFDDISDGKPFVELRGTKSDGSVGFQSMCPPSIHPSGEVLEMRQDGDIAHADDIKQRVMLYAIACILFKYLGNRGFGHDVRLAVVGFLLKKCGLTEEEVICVGEAVAEATSNSVAEVREDVRYTASRIKQGERVTGASALAGAIGDDGKKVIARIYQWLGAGEFACNPRTGAPIADNYENLQRALKKLGVQVSFNVFAQEARVTWKESTGPLDDAVRNRIWFEIEREFHFRPSAGYFDTFLQDVAQQHRFHPVQDYLNGLEWDGTPRLDSWLTTYGGAASNLYTQSVGALLLVAAVHRVREPGCKFDEMLVLESEQGQFKSTALRTLCPDEDWFSDDVPLNVDTKQLIERTLGKWIVEASDLHGYRTADIEHLKSMLSRRMDGPVRMAYARLPTQRPRHFVVVGSTNSHVYLKDATGNRRFWPVRVGRFDIDGLRSGRDQLWAEAARREADGESIRLKPELYPLAALQQERRRQIDPWEASLDEAYPQDQQSVRLTWNDIYGAVGVAVERRDERAHGRLVKILQQLGFRSMSVKRDGKVVRGMGRDAKQGELLSGDAGDV